MVMRLFAALIMTIGLLGLSAQSQAQSPAVHGQINQLGMSPLTTAPDTKGQPNQWVTRRAIKSYGRGYSDRRRANKEIGETLFTSSTTEPGIFFSCLDKKFRVGIVYEAQGMFEAFENMEIYGVSGNGGFVPTLNSLAHVSARFDGQAQEALGEWLYFKAGSTALSRDNMGAAKLYNAIVRGQNIQVTIRANNVVSLVFPEISNNFADFGAECGIGRQRGR